MILKTKNIEIFSDYSTCWINDSTGNNIGRFGQFGIDIHNPVEKQLEGNVCLCCTNGPTGINDWRRFKRMMRIHYGVVLSDKFLPKRLSEY